MEEVWKPIPGYEGEYEVSNWGRVRSLDRRDRAGARRKGKILRPSPHPKGYKIVHIYDRVFTIHELVALVFHGPRPDGMEVNHIDLDRANNRSENLEYLTRSQNVIHGILNNPASKRTVLTPAQVQEIRKTFTGKRGEQAHLARRYKVSPATISYILSGQRWPYL